MMHASNGPASRRGAILLVVMALLTLFAIVGISFVLYANSAATASRYFREEQSQTHPDVDPELLLNYFMGQFLFDAPDDEHGVYSSLRGHSLARNMFGANYEVVNNTAVYQKQDGSWINGVPFNGTGRLHTSPRGINPYVPGNYNNPFEIDDYELINYTFFRNDPQIPPANRFVRDPERYGLIKSPGLPFPWRTNPHDLPEAPDQFLYVGGFNAPYTYPDLNNLFLAAVKAGPLHIEDGAFTGDYAPGTLLTPSFHRPWLFRHETLNQLQDQGQVIGTFDRRNPNWTTPEGKYKILRPRPIDMGLGFPYPEDEGGDVKNLIGAPGYYDPVTHQVCNNDSIWLDLDFPVMTAPDGRKFKPLFAALVTDLDNRVNLNVHGNLRGENYLNHASNQGWGPWEVNPAKVLNYSPSPLVDPSEWSNLLFGALRLSGRYGLRDPPDPLKPPPYAQNGGDNRAPPLTPFRPYAPSDYDGSNELAGGSPSGQLKLPDFASPLRKCFPDVPAGYGADEIGESLFHPRLFNPFRPQGTNRAFALSDMEALLRYGDTGSGGLTSDLFYLCPKNFDDPSDPLASVKRRGLVTVHSFDVDRPGVTPYFWPVPNMPNAYNHLVSQDRVQYPPPPLHPFGDAVPFPSLWPPNPNPAYSEFGPDLRTTSLLTALRRVDLNRYLPDYPAIDPTTGQFIDSVQYEVATRARQYMAREIFDVLWKVTGAADPATISPPTSNPNDPVTQQFNALRSLAQLAVNIVDFIDSDDVMTPFQWYPGNSGYPGETVYGTELPRVLINEVYAEEVPDLSGSHSNLWVELYNPLSDDLNLTFQGAARLQTPNQDAIYQLVVSTNTSHLQNPNNVRGRCPGTVVSNFVEVGSDIPAEILPSNGGISGRGYYVIGQDSMTADHSLIPVNLTRPSLVGGSAANPLTVLLRRLACPYARHDPINNPYVTVDYMEQIPIQKDSTSANRQSWGRKQPFAGDHSGAEVETTVLNPGGPQHSLGRANFTQSPLVAQFDWLVHLDRKLISPLELLHVSAFKPHELTQQFMTGTGTFDHRARWFDEDLRSGSPGEGGPSHRLYRALEFLGTRSLVNGMMEAAVTVPQPIILPIPNTDPISVYPINRTMSGVSSSGGTWEIRPGARPSPLQHADQSATRLYLLPEVPQSLIIDRGVAGREEVVAVQEVIVEIINNKPIPTGFTAFFLRPHLPNFTVTPVTISDRVPGKVNLNTVWDQEVFQALADAYPLQRSNNFIPGEVDTIFTNLLKSRTPNTIPGKLDRPFLSLATGAIAGPNNQPLMTSGIDDTLLRSAPDDQGARRSLLELDREHPYQKYELMTKIFNNVTNRSNVFAVWLTVGFFEVTDDTTRPVKLGKELGRTENRQIRHRMFAIVDRSRLTANPGPRPHFNLRATPPASPAYTTGLVVPYFSIID